MAGVIKAREERDATHANEAETWKQAIKSGDPEDLVVRLLEATHWVARAQAERAVHAFLKKIKETLHKHIPVTAQRPLIANALSTAFQFQMSVWRMVGNECICLLWAKHSDWCGMASVVQAIVETFLNNCTIMFPQALMLAESFSTTFRPVSSEEEDNDEPICQGIHRFESSTPRPLVMGTAAPVTPQHSYPLLFSTEGISSCQVTKRRHPAVLSVHHHWKVRTPGCGHWTKT